MDDLILEPLHAYKSAYRQKFHDAANNYFDKLVAKSGVDVELNRKTVREYKAELDVSNMLAKKLARVSSLIGFLIFLAIAFFVAAILGIYFLAVGNTPVGASLLPSGIVLGVAMILIICLHLNKKRKAIKDEKAIHDARARELLAECWRQMEPLNNLFDSRITKALIEETVPLIKIDDNFSMHRYDYISNKYGFGENTDSNHSTLAILTGEIIGNPFIIDRELICSMGTQTYSGSIVIHWTTTYVDNEGHTHTQTHTQTLTAYVTKPKPFYSKQTRLIYGNEAAPDLVFSHEPTHAENMSDRKLAREVKSGTKELNKISAKAIKEGKSGLTIMANEEFDVLFNAEDRNDEVQFRLLMTPLAQKNLLALMKDNETGYGDDFYFYKRKCLNFISSEHSQNWDMDTCYKRYFHYDIDACKANFLNFNNQYFKSLYFDLAPLLSVPLYQQHKPHEYIYKDVYARNYTSYEAECAVNTMGRDVFKSPQSATDAILKTQLISKEGATDRVKITAYSYKGIERVEYVSKIGGDGHVHEVPVHWIEYIPITHENTVQLKEIPLTEKAFDTKAPTSYLKRALDIMGPRSIYSHGLLCCLLNSCGKDFDKYIDMAIARDEGKQ